MSIQRIFGIIVLIGGIVLIGFSMYIKSEVIAGNEQIAEGEQKINTADKLFSLSPTTKELGGQLTKGGKEKIAKGKEEISYYKDLANKLEIGGIVLIVAVRQVLANGLGLLGVSAPENM